MENINSEEVSESTLQQTIVSRLRIVMGFIFKLLNQFKISQQDLIDAGVYLPNRKV